MRLQNTFSSSIGSKIVIAFTGLALVAFLIAHLSGNLLFLMGPDAFNRYSHTLTSNPLIYGAELGLVAIFVLHIIKTVGTFASNQAARPHKYAVKKWAKSKNARSRKSLASTTMILTGTLTLLFVVTHLATFKFGRYYETPDGLRDIYRLQLETFSSPLYVAFYLVCMSIIFFHLWHGVGSAAQSLGADNPTWTPRIVAAGHTMALLVAGGFFILPVYTFLLAQGLP